MRLYKILDNVVLDFEYHSNNLSPVIVSGNRKDNGEPVFLKLEITNCTSIQMALDTIDAAVEEELGLKYSYTYDPNLEAKLAQELLDLNSENLMCSTPSQ